LCKAARRRTARVAPPNAQGMIYVWFIGLAALCEVTAQAASGRRLRAEWSHQHPDHAKMFGKSLRGNPSMLYFDGFWTEWRRKLFARLPEVYPQSFFNTPRDMYEFGVYTGAGLREILHLAQKYHFPVRNTYGFDSFQGLPKEQPGVPLDPRLENSWKEGAFDASAILSAGSVPLSVDETVRRVNDYVLANITLSQGSSLELIPGYYSSSLTPGLLQSRNMQPAMYIDIDVDIYRSSMEALRWMFANGLVTSGTVIGYDDWSHKNGGEIKAHHDISLEFNVTFKQVFIAGGAAAFTVTSLGEKKGS